MVDGCLGMAYGVCTNTFLLALGVPPALASAGLHSAEVFTTFTSGISHWRFGNVDRRLLLTLIPGGVLGGVAGAYILTSIPGDLIKPYIAAYLMVLGGVIIASSVRRVLREKRVTTYLGPLSFAGGFMDAVGGGGWGPVMTTTLVARGHPPHEAIGSVNGAEFFVTLVQAVTFLLALGLPRSEVFFGLLIGGVLAAPLAAYLCRRIPRRLIMVLVGLLVMGISARTLLLSLG